MSDPKKNRREFLRASATGPLVMSLVAPAGIALAQETRSKNDRPRMGLIGAGGQGSYDAKLAAPFADFLAICDADDTHANYARADPKIGKGKADAYKDYRKVLDRKDIDAVIIGTPDHWHTKICIDAMRAGKDVYCEKPLTLTIDEGKKPSASVAKETGRVVQVGTQQRSDHNRVFLLAVALVQAREASARSRRSPPRSAAPPRAGPFPKVESSRRN